MNKRMLCLKGLDEELKVVCPKCDTEMKAETRGGQHFDQGEVWDDITAGFVCPNCGYEIFENEPAIDDELMHAWAVM